MKRVCLLILLLPLSGPLPGCNAWKPAPVTQLELSGELKPRRVRLTTDRAVIEMVVIEVLYPYVEGYAVDGVGRATKERVVVDLREVRRAEIYQFDGRRSALSLAAAVDAPVSVIAATLFMVLLQTSCPYVYVDAGEGLALVGEAYPGAVLRSLERDDLLPLPALPQGQLKLRLSNEAYETQYTDRAALILVDHEPSLRALATPDAKIVYVGPATAATEILDLRGADQSEKLLRQDGDLWEGVLFSAALSTDPPLREGLVASFPAPAPGARPVLELVLGNSSWLDVVFSRYFALYGNFLRAFFRVEDNPAWSAEVVRWRERAGIDLRVELSRGGAFRPVTVVLTQGPLALRHLAIPLPEVAPGDASEPLRVRVSGGVGFWRFDAIALSQERPGEASVHELTPASAELDGEDQLPLLLAADDRRQVLEEIGQRVDLRFELPVLPEGKVRDAFLLTRGYYNVHKPVQGDWTPRALEDIREDPENFIRFSLGLYREYSRLARSAPRGERP
jgi:hypothetical protein